MASPADILRTASRYINIPLMTASNGYLHSSILIHILWKEKNIPLDFSHSRHKSLYAFSVSLHGYLKTMHA